MSFLGNNYIIAEKYEQFNDAGNNYCIRAFCANSSKVIVGIPTLCNLEINLASSVTRVQPSHFAASPIIVSLTLLRLSSNNSSYIVSFSSAKTAKPNLP